jgi:hypothetical protein
MADTDLKKQAAELGIAVDKRWGDARIQSEIDAKLAEPPAADPIDHDGNGKKGGAVKTALVFLDYDTWIDGERMRAFSSNAVSLPLDRAKELLAAGKARRADPLPGDE